MNIKSPAGLSLLEALYACNYIQGKQPFWASGQWIYFALDPAFITENTNKIGRDS